MYSSPYSDFDLLIGRHTDSVNCLAFSATSTYLASDSDDGLLIIWDILKGKSINKFQLRSPVTSLTWVPTRSASVVCGCLNGTMQMYHNVNNPGVKREPTNVLLGIRTEVYCVDMEVNSSYLAVGIGSEVHVAREQALAQRVYASFAMLPKPKDLPPSPDSDHRIRARSLHLLKDSSHIIVTYLNHGIVCWNFNQGAQLWQIVPSHPYRHLGSSTLAPNQRSILVYNMHNAMDLYPLRQGSKPQESFPYEPDEARHYIMQVSFLHNGSAVIGGSSRGICAIWEITGELMQELEHDGDTIQAIATCSTANTSYIATAPVKKGTQTYIKIYKAPIGFKDYYVSPFLEHPLAWTQIDLDDHQKAIVITMASMIVFYIIYLFQASLGIAEIGKRRLAIYIVRFALKSLVSLCYFLTTHAIDATQSVFQCTGKVWGTVIAWAKASAREFLEINE